MFKERWPWRDPYDGSLLPGWALSFMTGGLVVVGLFILWINDMHMYGYGPWSK